jgi:phospholipase/carboxylesterase
MRTTVMAELTVRITGGTDREGGGDGPVVVLLHGFGAPGDDLVPLQRVLAVPREVRFVFPEARLAPPELAAYGGRAWWHIDTVALQRAAAEGRARERAAQVPPGLAEARTQLSELLDAVELELGVAGRHIILGGFSQGSMLACDLALRSKRELAGLVLLSSTLLCEPEWQPLMAARKGLPVLQTHGTRDPLLAIDMARDLRRLLETAGLALEWYEFIGGHELPPAVLSALGAFITKHA